MGVTVRKDRVADVVAAIKKLTSQEILVGIPHESPARNVGPGQSGEPITDSELGYIHEFGAPEANIPARPFLIPGVENALKAGLTDKLKKTAQTALDGELSKVAAQMTAMGQIAQAAVQAKIVSGPFKPLKPATLAARRARGVTRTAPLIDTGAMRQAVTFIVTKKVR